ncbi:hypothetical protein [Phyllobacterium salinisoli]|uniref:hypothetical protein n=1 Tax=Phyllobacterium salinisoli TaxID=1899321 RepID=UPI00190FA6D6|nr:hypothetical protein [Phyllobacterium salinisoli]
MLSELSNLFAARCEAVWSDTTKRLHAPAERDDDPQNDETTSSDAVDEFVYTDRMMSLWYGEKKRCRSLTAPGP